MRVDVIKWSQGQACAKVISKETLNHPQLIEYVSGLDVYAHTREAYLRAYRATGIDLINRVPLENARLPLVRDERSADPNTFYAYSPLGVYDTATRIKYECSAVEQVWDLDVEALCYKDLVTPVPHPCEKGDIRIRNAALGEIGLYYPMLYTTLFMWPVEVLGWEVFMLAAGTEPERFHKHFLLPWVAKSQAIVDEILAADSPFLFVHDDLADQNGPVFPPLWYSDFIFPHYREIWSKAKELGRKVIFVADGNMTAFLPWLLDAGVDGIMCENPATPLEAVVEHFGAPGRFFVGGIEPAKLTFGDPDEIRKMVLDVARKCTRYSGFAIASCGGLHGNIPMANLEAYFDARTEIGATDKGWRHLARTDATS
jgi:hypothetical protein